MMLKAVSILGVAVVLAATGAAAEPQTMRSVHFADLNLQTPEGVATLERRIDRAARTMCATNVAAFSSALDNARDTCMAETLAGTRASIDAAVRHQRAQMLQTAAAR